MKKCNHQATSSRACRNPRADRLLASPPMALLAASREPFLANVPQGDFNCRSCAHFVYQRNRLLRSGGRKASPRLFVRASSTAPGPAWYWVACHEPAWCSLVTVAHAAVFWKTFLSPSLLRVVCVYVFVKCPLYLDFWLSTTKAGESARGSSTMATPRKAVDTSYYDLFGLPPDAFAVKAY